MKIKEEFDDMPQGISNMDDAPMVDIAYDIDDSAEEVSGIVAEPTKVVLDDGSIVLASVGDEVTFVSESKIHKILKNKRG